MSRLTGRVVKLERRAPRPGRTIWYLGEPQPPPGILAPFVARMPAPALSVEKWMERSEPERSGTYPTEADEAEKRREYAAWYEAMPKGERERQLLTPPLRATPTAR